MENYITIFFDILGTKYKVKTDTFTAYESLDFSNPSCLMAKKFPSINMSVFSDSVITACKPEEIDSLLEAITFLYKNWFSDKILVRGGMALGKLAYASFPELDEMFSNLENLSFTRVYGQSLVDAITVEGRSGPGAVLYLHHSVREIIPDEYVGEGHVDFLNWMKPKDRKWVIEYCQQMMDETKNVEEQRHLKSTLFLLEKCTA
jgi:hypothetical protein